jgi:O-antigen/teichoic acid export membrane protein
MRLRLAFFYSFGQVGGQLVLKFLANVILARLLLPGEIGVFAVAFALVLILNSLRDFGVNRYLIKEVELTEEKLATVYTLAIGFGWGLW